LGHRGEARKRLHGRIHAAYLDQAEMFIGSVLEGASEQLARAAVERTRPNLGLPPGEWAW
jgi:hypothetical protein